MLARKLTTEQRRAYARKVFEQTDRNQSETARILTDLWGFRVPRSTVQNLLSAADVPLSENLLKISNASPEECIKELQRIAEANPERVISRNYFRNNSVLAESAWSGHFGTFAEFKRQAKVVLTRHQHRMELDVARHASLDNFRFLTEIKRGWGDTYNRPQGGRYVTMMTANDVHDIECDPFWREVFIDTARRIQPDIVALNGDIFDLPEFGKYAVDPREWDVVGRIRWVHDFLHDLREAAPDAQVDFIEGNHEYRLLRHLAEATPAMQAVLADLHGFDVPRLLGLEEFEVNYIAPADLATLTKADAQAELRRNFKVYFDMYCVSHFPDARKFGMPGTSGHHHGHELWRSYSPAFGTYEWHQVGCGHKREASYCNGEKWGMGFAISHLNTETKKTHIEHVEVSDFSVVGGRFYERTGTIA